MGGVCARPAVTDSLSLPVNAPVQVVMATIADIDSYASFLRHVTWVKRQGSGDLKVGTRYAETRKYAGHAFRQHVTVTELGVDPVRVGSGGSFARGPYIRDVEFTMTMTMIPVDDASCEIVGTFGFQPGGIRGWWKQVTCHACLVREGHHVLEHELLDYTAEAEKRYEKQTKIRTTD